MLPDKYFIYLYFSEWKCFCIERTNH